MEQATNLFTKGLLLDTHPMVLSNDTLTDCLNGTLITMNGNEVILQNDMGNRRVDKAFLPPGYEPVGMKEYGGIIYVASYNPITNKSLIGSFPSPLKKLSSNTTGEAPVFDFNSFTSGSNIEQDPNLGDINVLKSDSFMIPLTKDLNLRAGDKFAIYSSGLSDLSSLLTNYNNTLDGKALSPKNRKYTLLLGVLNSLNEFVDITKTLCRWKKVGNNSELIKYNSEVSETFKFNDGYFISDSFTTSFNEETIEDAKLIKERLKIAANTYAYKLVGPLYLKVILNHIENFNYNIYGTYDNGYATLWVEGYITYNCPDGALTILNEGINSNEDYYTFDEGIPDKNRFGFDLIGWNPESEATLIENSVYNPSTNTYTTKIVKKYTNVTGDNGTSIFNYVLGVKADLDSSVYLRGLSVKGSIDLSLLGSGTLKINGWRFYNNFQEKTSTITYSFNAYPEYGKSFVDLEFIFLKFDSNNTIITYPSSIYNGRLTISFNWANIGLKDNEIYRVTARYRIKDDKTGTYGSFRNILESSDRWFLTTELFNDFYKASSGISDFCNVPNNSLYSSFYNKMIVNIDSKNTIINESSLTEEFEGKLISNRDPYISYLCKHTHDIKITIQPELEIRNKDLYPSYILIRSNKKNAVKINNIKVSKIGNHNNPESTVLQDSYNDYSEEFRPQLITTEGINLSNLGGIDPRNKLAEQILLKESTELTNSKLTIKGTIIHYDAFKSYGSLITTINNAFLKFSKSLLYVTPTAGYYGGVISDFDVHGGMFGDTDDSHFLEVAINQASDRGSLPEDHDIPTGWEGLVETKDDDRVSINIDLYTGRIYLSFNESVRDTDITFLYYFVDGNLHTTSVNNITGKDGGLYTRVWWKMPNGEWAVFPSLYTRGSSFDDFIKTCLGNKDIVYCMYDEYSENSFMYTAKENYIYYNRYNIPMEYTISYALQDGETISGIVDQNILTLSCGNLRFSMANTIEFSSDTVEFILLSSEKFYDNIHQIDPDNISNICLINGEDSDSMGRPLNRNYIYYYSNNLLYRIDRSYFYVDSINKILDGRNKLLYNEYTKSSVNSYRYQSSGEGESHTVIIYNSLNVVKSIT